MSVRRLVLILCLAGTLASAALPASAGAVAAAEPGPSVAPELARRLDRVLHGVRSRIRLPALVAAMRFADGSTWSGALGHGQVGDDGPLGPAVSASTTPFVIGSITKTFVAALALQLQEEGRLSLDDPVHTWLPEIRRGRAITLRMLLDHQSGLADYFWHPDYEALVFGRPTHHWTVDEILALAAERAPLFRPGRSFSYSNTNYVVAGRILEIVGGESLGRQITERFIEPLGLDATVFQDEPFDLVGAMGYLREDRAWIDQSDGTLFRPSTSAATVAWAAGAMQSSATDLLRWETALYGGEILGPESMAQLLGLDPGSGYALATRRQTLAGRAGYGHGGSLRGFVAVMYRLPAAGIEVVVMTNRGRVDAVVAGVADALVRAAIDLAPSPTPSSPLRPV